MKFYINNCHFVAMHGDECNVTRPVDMTPNHLDLEDMAFNQH